MTTKICRNIIIATILLLTPARLFAQDEAHQLVGARDWTPWTTVWNDKGARVEISFKMSKNNCDGYCYFRTNNALKPTLAPGSSLSFSFTYDDCNGQTKEEDVLVLLDKPDIDAEDGSWFTAKYDPAIYLKTKITIKKFFDAGNDGKEAITAEKENGKIADPTVQNESRRQEQRQGGNAILADNVARLNRQQAAMNQANTNIENSLQQQGDDGPNSATGAIVQSGVLQGSDPRVGGAVLGTAVLLDIFGGTKKRKEQREEQQQLEAKEKAEEQQRIDEQNRIAAEEQRAEEEREREAEREQLLEQQRRHAIVINRAYLLDTIANAGFPGAFTTDKTVYLYVLTWDDITYEHFAVYMSNPIIVHKYADDTWPLMADLKQQLRSKMPPGHNNLKICGYYNSDAVAAAGQRQLRENIMAQGGQVQNFDCALNSSGNATTVDFWGNSKAVTPSTQQAAKSNFWNSDSKPAAVQPAKPNEFWSK